MAGLSSRYKPNYLYRYFDENCFSPLLKVKSETDLPVKCARKKSFANLVKMPSRMLEHTPFVIKVARLVDIGDFFSLILFAFTMFFRSSWPRADPKNGYYRKRGSASYIVRE